MKTPLLLLTCIALLIGPYSFAQTSKEGTAKPRQIEEFLDGIPKGDLLKLRGPKQNDAALEFSKKIGDAELNREGTFRITVESVHPHLFRDENAKGWLMHGRYKPIKVGAVAISVVTHIWFRQDPDKIIEKIRSGRDLLVTGTVTKAEIVMNNGAPALWVDVNVAGFSLAK